MGSFLGWALVIAAVWMLISAFRRPAEATAEAAPRSGPNRGYLVGSAVALVVGLGLAFWPSIALARLTPKDLKRQDAWVMNPPTGETAPIRWEGDALVADMEAGSARYAVFPVDWEANRFVASFDITFSQLDLPGQEIPLKVGDKANPTTQMHKRTNLDFAAATVGLMDQSIANIDDRDHVSGSAIEACFSTDIRLRASDANYIVRTSSSTESGKEKIDPFFKPGTPLPVELGKKYRCVLSYDGRNNQADLKVSDEGGRAIVERRLEDLKDFTNSVTWFGISVRGYNRFDKKLDPTKADNGYTRPTVKFRLENLQYSQP
jgi:hypothetical protein